jgi:hypothetical protein
MHIANMLKKWRVTFTCATGRYFESSILRQQLPSKLLLQTQTRRVPQGKTDNRPRLALKHDPIPATPGTLNLIHI